MRGAALTAKGLLPSVYKSRFQWQNPILTHCGGQTAALTITTKTGFFITIQVNNRPDFLTPFYEYDRELQKQGYYANIYHKAAVVGVVVILVCAAITVIVLSCHGSFLLHANLENIPLCVVCMIPLLFMTSCTLTWKALIMYEEIESARRKARGGGG